MNITYQLEFGHRAHTRSEPQYFCEVFESLTLAQKLAAALVRLLSTHIDEGQAADDKYWHLKGSTPRATWQNENYYVVLTRLDGKTKFPPANTTF